MRVEIGKDGKTEIALTREEWERYGNSMGWKVSEGIKTASSPSIKVVPAGKSHQIVMNRAGWEMLGKKAQFYDFDDEPVSDGMSEGEKELYGDEEEAPQEEDYLDMLGDVDTTEDLSAEEEAEEEAFDLAAEALGTATIGITDKTVPTHNAPYMIISALEPISEFRDIDMTGDPVEAISEYLSEEPKNESERRVMDMVRDALKSGGMETGELVV